jgi:hypothetical protein
MKQRWWAIGVLILIVGLASAGLGQQEMKGMPMGGGAMEMKGKMGEMEKGMSGMMKEQGMLKADDPKSMGKMMGRMSGMMADMGQRVESGEATPDEMANMSKMIEDMSGMMKQMSGRMKPGMKKPDTMKKEEGMMK